MDELNEAESNDIPLEMLQKLTQTGLRISNNLKTLDDTLKILKTKSNTLQNKSLKLKVLFRKSHSWYFSPLSL